MRLRLAPWLLLPALVLATSEDPSPWALQGGAVADGAFWRLWSGHWCHFGWEHLFWDGLVFLLLTTFLETRLTPTRLLGLLILAPPLLSLGLLALFPEGMQYRGLSGLNALFLTLAALSIWHTGDHTARLGAATLLLLWLGKTALEGLGGAVWHPLPPGVGLAWQAHVLGMGLGLIWGWVERRTPWSRYELDGVRP